MYAYKQHDFNLIFKYRNIYLKQQNLAKIF